MSRHLKRTEETHEKKLSVFERLGSKFGGAENEIICRSWATTQSCALGQSCKLSHTHRLISPSKHSKHENMRKGSSSKKSAKSHKSLHTVATTPPRPTTWEKWDFGDLEGADEKDLQKRRLQLQRELKLQMKREIGVTTKKKKKKDDRKIARSPSTSSSTTSESSSSSSSSMSSIHSRKRVDRKRKGSPSSASDDSSHRKKRKIPKSPPKIKVVVKKKVESPRKPTTSKRSSVIRKSHSPMHARRHASPKRKTPVRAKPSRPPSPKHKPRGFSPRRTVKPKDHRSTPPRPARPRSAERRRHHSPRRRPDRGGLEKGGKILPVKSSAYVKEMKESVRKKSADRQREEKEKEREKEKEKRRREQKAREVERREREREAERVRKETERQKEREDALERCRERQRDRDRVVDRVERTDRDKRVKEFDRKEVDPRKSEVKSDLPSLLDIKTEAPRDNGGRAWEDRRSRRPDENFEFRRVAREETPESRRGRKPHDFPHESVGWESNEEFREPPSSDWPRDWKPRWAGEGNREGSWREQFPGRRSDWQGDAPPPEDHQLPDDRSLGEAPRRPAELPMREGSLPTEGPPAEGAGDLEEALSDISDDDDILNQVEEQPVDPGDSHGNSQPAGVLSQQGAEFFFDHRRPLLECLGERGLDFEEISDEELEEEARMSKGIMDVLGADWASLMKQTPVKTVKVDGTGSALRRWRVDSIIARVGISRTIAGDDWTNKYLAKIKDQCLEADMAKDPIKKEKVEDDDESSNAVEIKKENGECKPESELDLLHPLPAVHATLFERNGQSAVQRLLNARFKRALSARTDLAIRRVICGFSTKEPINMTGCEHLFESSVALFKSAVA